MNNDIALKVWRIDYDFLIKNYLDRSLWNKVWNLFTYKNFNFTLSLRCIHTKAGYIAFEIASTGTTMWTHTKSVEYYFNNPEYTIAVLKKQINGAIFNLMIELEEDEIESSLEYFELLATKEQEENTLIDIANSFLNENGVTNSDIRDAYIDAFVSKASTMDSKLTDYRIDNKYKHYTEMMLAFAIATDDKTRFDTIRNAQNNDSKIKNIINTSKEIKALLENGDLSMYEDYLEDV